MTHPILEQLAALDAVFFPNGKPGGRSRRAGQSSGWRARLRRWLGRLDTIGLDLAETITILVRRPGGSGGIDTGLAWRLVIHGLHWARALRNRLATEARDDMDARGESDKPSPDRPDRENLLAGLGFTNAAPKAKPVPYACIAGVSDSQVVEHVCADLTAAATILGDSEASRQIARIAKAVRTLLDSRNPDDAKSSDPKPADARVLPTEAAWAKDMMARAAANVAAQFASTGARAPDTG